jgi:hypothetical protein
VSTFRVHYNISHIVVGPEQFSALLFGVGVDLHRDRVDIVHHRLRLVEDILPLIDQS